MKATIMLMLAAMLVAAASGQTASQPTRKTRKTAVKPPAITAADVQALKDAIAAQQQQLQQMQQQLQSRDAAFQQSQEQTQRQLQQAQAAAAEAQAKVSALETRN